ncbi:transposase [[Pasteurella] aerogenes]|nr:transposase [[Pasteurella] aerogenes]
MIKFYLQNGKNQSLTCRHFQFNKTTLRHWIKQYNRSSINGLAVCHTKTGILSQAQVICDTSGYSSEIKRTKPCEIQNLVL